MTGTSGGGAAAVRPAVSVVVPFSGTTAEAESVIAMLRMFYVREGDQLIVSDNSGTVPAGIDGVVVVRAPGEASASHARNAGAGHARNDWILFLDSDVRPPAELLDAFFSDPVGAEIGAITGDIAGIPSTRTLAARYGTARNFLGQRSHVMNPFRPRASSANLLVRRVAFEQVGGYTEGIWAAEDTDFTWRLQEHGWKLGFQEHAVVEHEYRDTLRALGRQWRGYAAGARWLSERYPDFKPDPGINRMVRRVLRRVGIGPGVAFRADGRSSAASRQLGWRDRAEFFLVDCMLGIEEQIGLRMSNRVKPRGQRDDVGAREP
jgi:glycosyltransferase involved in cell wall biosynthesis